MKFGSQEALSATGQHLSLFYQFLFLRNEILLMFVVT